MQKLVVFLTVVLTAAGAFAQNVPVVGAEGKTVADLVGKDTLVTIVLNDSGAADPNLRIVDVSDGRIVAETREGSQTYYQFSLVKEVRVQEDVVEVKQTDFLDRRSLHVEDRKVVARAMQRAKQIYASGNADQGLKMYAAGLLAANGDKEAEEYLKRLVTSNDLATQLDAALYLHLRGEKEIDSGILIAGLQSGNLQLRAKAADLAGLMRCEVVTPLLLDMVNDRSAELSAPAIRALAWLGNKQCIPEVLDMLVERNDDKGAAAVFALTKFGGAEVISQVKDLLEKTTSQSRGRYRVVYVLYKLGDPLGKKLMKEEMLTIPTLAPDAAITLAEKGDFEAMEFLHERIKQRFDETPEILIRRAKMASALISGGDPQAISILQEILRFDNPTVRMAVCRLVTELGMRKLITMMQPTIENADEGVALAACSSVVAIAKDSFRERLLEAYH